MNKKLQEQAKEIKKIAEESGVQSNFLFITTFERYLVQLEILDQLESTIKESELLVTKEYVKGRKNVYTNPAVKEYNSTTDSSNKTVACLLKIIRNFNVNDAGDEEDPLLSIINGSEENEEQ